MLPSPQALQMEAGQPWTAPPKTAGKPRKRGKCALGSALCQRLTSIRTYLMFVFRFSSALVALMTMGLYTMTALDIIGQLAYSHLGSAESRAHSTLTGFTLVFSCFLVTEVTVMLIDFIAVFVTHVAFMVGLMEKWRHFFDWQAVNTVLSSTKARIHVERKRNKPTKLSIGFNNPFKTTTSSTAMVGSSNPLTHVTESLEQDALDFDGKQSENTFEQQQISIGPANHGSTAPAHGGIEAPSSPGGGDTADAVLHLAQHEKYEQARRFIAADFAQFLVDCAFIIALIASVVFGSVMVTAPGVESPDDTSNLTLRGKAPSITQGFEGYMRAVAVSCISITSLAMYLGVFVFFVCRAVFAAMNTLRFVGRLLLAYRSQFKHCQTYLWLVVYMIMWPALLAGLTGLHMGLRACGACCGQFGSRLLEWVDGSYEALIVPQWAHLLQRDTHTPLFQQKPFMVMIEEAAGFGSSTYELIRSQLRSFTGWYIIIWFFGSLVYLQSAPTAVAGVGFIGICGFLASVWREAVSKKAERARKVLNEVEKLAPALDRPASSRMLGPLRELQTTRSLMDQRKASRDIDTACTWGSCMYLFTLAGMWAAFALAPGLGVFMMILLALLTFNWCMPSPSRTICSTLCRLIIVIIAAVYGAFTNAYVNDAGTIGLLTSLNGTAVPFPPATSYPICSQQIGGLAPVDYCVLSALAYSQDDYMRQDVATWFGAAGHNMTEATIVRLSSGLRYFAFQRQDTVRNETYIYVSVRGSRAERDFTQDLFLWQEALLFQALEVFGPCAYAQKLSAPSSVLHAVTLGLAADNSYPISVRQAFIKTIARIGDFFQTPEDRTYAADLVDGIAKLQADYPGSQVIVTGHSLGGGLASFMTQHLKLPSVSISGPGTVLTGPKLGMGGPYPVYGGSLVIIPDFDIVPRVDMHLGAVQNIKCLGSTSAADCHSCARSCCELLRSCGDPYGRTLIPCP